MKYAFFLVLLIATLFWFFSDVDAPRAELPRALQGADAEVVTAELGPHAQPEREASVERQATVEPMPENAFRGEEGSSLLVRVAEEHNQAPVTGARVWLAATGGGKREGESDALGEVRFSELEAGPYMLSLDPESLAEGLLVPRDHFFQANRNEDIGTQVELDTGEHSEVILAVERAARLYGTVREAGGGPIPWTNVDGRSRHGLTVWLDAHDGHFDAQVYPGRWTLSPGVGVLRSRAADALSHKNHPLRGVPSAAPVIVNLDPGTAHQVDLILGGGTCELKCAVHDEWGQPVTGLRVLLYFKEGTDPTDGSPVPFSMLQSVAGAYTTEEGFNFADLHPGTYRIQLEPDGRYPFGENKLASVQSPIDITLDQPVHHQTLVVDRACLVHVSGIITFDPAWDSLQRMSPVLLALEAVLTEGKRHTSDRRHRLDVSEEGSFSVIVDAREEIVLLEISARGDSIVVPVSLPEVSPNGPEHVFVPIRFPN